MSNADRDTENHYRHRRRSIPALGAHAMTTSVLLSRCRDSAFLSGDPSAVNGPNSVWEPPPPPEDCTNSAVLRERLSAGLHSRASPYTYGAGSGTVIMNRV